MSSPRVTVRTVYSRGAECHSGLPGACSKPRGLRIVRQACHCEIQLMIQKTASLIIATGMLLLAACAAPERTPVTGGVSTFELRRDVMVPANQARVIFQHGRPMSGKNLFDWHCELEISTVSESPQRVSADSFLVTAASARIVRDELSGMPAMPFGVLDCGDRFYETHYRLRSTRQPGVRKMICRNGYTFCSGGRFAGPHEMREIFGDWIVVR